MGEALGHELFLEALRVEPREGVGTRAKVIFEVSHGWMAARPVSPPSLFALPCRLRHYAHAAHRGAAHCARTSASHTSTPQLQRGQSLTQRDCLSRPCDSAIT